MRKRATLRYCGTLYFEDGDPIEVRTLIVRDDSISFDLVGGWGEHGMWARSGVANRVGAAFHSDFKPSYKDGIEGYFCKIVFGNVDGGDIDGSWVEQGEERDFSGSLERC